MSQLQYDPTQAKQATSKEMRENKRKCWSPPCQKTAWFQDWAGWNWCFNHVWSRGVEGETLGHTWVKLKYLKVRYPF